MKHLGNLFIISAASGAGKTSLVRDLIKNFSNLVPSVSYTTRLKRPKERDGIDYFFINKYQFKAMTDRNEFIETSIVFDNCYGTNRNCVENLLANGRDVILEIDWQGARKVKQYFNKLNELNNIKENNQIIEYISIFILPPSLQALSKRLRARGQDKLSVIEKRLNAAQQEIRHYVDYDYIVINDSFNQAIRDLEIIISCQKLKRSQQEVLHAGLIKNLLL